MSKIEIGNPQTTTTPTLLPLGNCTVEMPYIDITKICAHTKMEKMMSWRSSAVNNNNNK